MQIYRAINRAMLIIIEAIGTCKFIPLFLDDQL